jgi:hypothetical protein
LLDTVTLFVPSLTEQYLDEGSEERNREFLQQYANIVYPNRTAGVTDVDMSFVQSGDMLAIHRMDGLGSLEQWISGESTSHIAMFMRMPPDNTLYVVESTDTTSFWPNPNIQKTQYDPQWKAMAIAANYSIAVLPLKAEVRAKWNQATAEEYLASSLGDPYGYNNFLWTVIDSPTGNFPWPISWQLLENLFGVIETVDPDMVQQFVSLAMQKRLNTNSSLTIPQQAIAARAQLDLSFGELFSLPEQDAWVYPDGPSLVCDSYAVEIYKYAGLLDGLVINAAEFDNSGAYRLNFFDIQNSTYDPRPLACQQADPNMPYCILMGDYAIPLHGVSTIAPYSHMQEHCTGLPPNYSNPPNC